MASTRVLVSMLVAATAAVSAPQLAAPAHSPSFLALHPSLPVLYAVSEVANADDKRSRAVQAFAIAAATGSLTPLNHQPSGGSGPCHVSVDARGRVALAANYGGGSAICLGLAA